MQRVEICGGIAAGKTSLARCLTHNGAGRLIEERFREVPFWEKFYAAPQVYAFEKNVSFLLFHADSIGDIMQLNDQRLAICDFAMFQDLAYASLGAASADLHIVRPIYDKLIKRIGFPSLIVKLNCAPETQLERIRRRARPQEKSIEMSYLVELGAKESRRTRSSSRRSRKLLLSKSIPTRRIRDQSAGYGDILLHRKALEGAGTRRARSNPLSSEATHNRKAFRIFAHQ